MSLATLGPREPRSGPVDLTTNKSRVPAPRPPVVDPKVTATVLLAILDGLSNHTYSPDVWWLALNDAAHVCARMGVTREDFEAIRDRFHAYRVAKKDRDDTGWASFFGEG